MEVKEVDRWLGGGNVVWVCGRWYEMDGGQMNKGTT